MQVSSPPQSQQPPQPPSPSEHPASQTAPQRSGPYPSTHATPSDKGKSPVGGTDEWPPAWDQSYTAAQLLAKIAELQRLPDLERGEQSMLQAVAQLLQSGPRAGRLLAHAGPPASAPGEAASAAGDARADCPPAPTASPSGARLAPSPTHSASQTLTNDSISVVTSSSSVQSSFQSGDVELSVSVHTQQEVVRTLRRQERLQTELNHQIEQNCRLLRSKEDQIKRLQKKVDDLSAKETKRVARGEKVFQHFMGRQSQHRSARSGGGSADSRDRKVMDMLEYLQQQLDAKSAHIAKVEEQAADLRRGLRDRDVARERDKTAVEGAHPARQDGDAAWMELLRDKTAQLEEERQKMTHLHQINLRASEKVAKLLQTNAQLKEEVQLLQQEQRSRPTLAELQAMDQRIQALTQELHQFGKDGQRPVSEVPPTRPICLSCPRSWCLAHASTSSPLSALCPPPPQSHPPLCTSRRHTGWGVGSCPERSMAVRGGGGVELPKVAPINCQVPCSRAQEPKPRGLAKPIGGGRKLG